MHSLTILIALISGLSFAAPRTGPNHRSINRNNATIDSNGTAFAHLQLVPFEASPLTKIESPSTPGTTAAIETSASTPSPLWCGVHYSITPGKGFNLCNGNWTILDFCSSGSAGYGDALEDGHLKPTTRYHPLEPDSGIVCNLRLQHDYAKCDFSSQPPENPIDYGDYVDSRCVEILATLMNDCDTTTTTKKFGGTKNVGCEIWSMFSVSGEAGKAFPQYSGDMDAVEECRDEHS